MSCSDSEEEDDDDRYGENQAANSHSQAVLTNQAPRYPVRIQRSIHRFGQNIYDHCE